MKKFCFCSVAILLIASFGTAAGQSPEGTQPVTGLQRNTVRSFVIAGATVVTRPGQAIEDASIVIDRGVITAIGQSIKTPPQARRINAEGKMVYAGLVDAFSEIEVPAVDAGSRHWNSRVTPQRLAATAWKPDEKLNQKLRQQGITARLLVPSNGLFKGVSALVTTGDEGPVQAMIKAQVAQHLALTPRRRSRGSGYPGSPMGAVALARQTFYDVMWYRDAWQQWQASLGREGGFEQPETNLAIQALVDQLDNGVPLVVDASDERYVLRAHRLAVEFDLSVIIRGSGREYRRLEEIAATGHAILLPVSFPKAPDVSTPEAARYASLERLMHWDIAPENPARLANAEVRFAMTSDRLKDPGGFLAAVRKAVARGLDETTALAALTTVPAEILGVEDRLGSIQVGRAAHLVITDGSLFDKKTKVIETWVAGVRYQNDRFDLLDVRGTWSLVLQSADGTQIAGTLELRGKRSKLDGEFKMGDQTHKIKNVSWSKRRLTFAIPAAPLAEEGLARMTFVVTAPGSEDLAARATMGQGVLPDGMLVTGKLIRTRPWSPQSDKQAREEASDEDESTAAEGESVEAASDNEEGVGDEDGDSEAKMDRSALFEVNYPLGAYGRDGPPPQPARVFFKGGTVWTCGSAGKLENATVQVEQGRIVAVGVDLEIPDGATVIECQGKHLTPGIIDCHSHIATDGGVNESTQSITAEVRIGDFVDGDDIAIYRQLAGGVTAANVLHGSANPIGGQNQVIKMRWGASPEAMKFQGAPPGIKFALGENVKQSNRPNSYSRYPQTRMGVDEIINDAFRRAQDYSQRHAAWQKERQGLPPRVDLELKALAEVLAGERWIHCHSYRQSEILALLNTCRRFDVTIGTLQHILEGYKVAREMERDGVMGSSFADWWAYKFEVYDAIPYSAALMHDAGVVVSFNSDDAELGRRLNLEAAKAVRFGGVPPEEALKFVTLNPARQLRIDERVGSLEAGKDADIVVWSGSPLSVYAICEQTWIDGRRYFELQEDAQLRTRDRSRHTRLVQKIIDSGAAQLKPGEREFNPLAMWPRRDEFCRCRQGFGEGD